jgi:DNA-directed RNA polymerase subunit H (RpoH/RPB5)
MSDQDIFETKPQTPTETKPSETTQTAETPPAPPSDPFVDKLMEIKNENGEPKYKSVEAALEALKASQQFIETLKTEKQGVLTELDQAKAELAKMGNIDDFVKRIAPNASPEPTKTTVEKSQSLSEEEVTRLLETALSKREQESRSKANLDSVIAEVSKTHGDKAASVIAQRAKELQTTPEALRELAKANPTMALTLLQVKTQPSVQPSRSTTIAPISPTSDNSPPVFEKSAARGGFSNKELLDRWRQVKDFTYKNLNVET